METTSNKKEMKIIKWSSIAGILLFIVILVIQIISTKNDEKRYRNLFETQLGEIELIHDNMWKVLTTKAGVTKEYASQFDSIYTHIMNSRYDSKDGVLFNWISESNPEFSSDLYKELSVTIEVERKKFLDSQTKILDIVREHNNLLDTAPSGWWLSGAERLEYKPITSTKTKDVMNSGVDDENVNLF